MQGRLDLAADRSRAAIDDTNRLIATEPHNTRSLEFGFKAHLTLADILLRSGNRTEAAAQSEIACGIVSTLLSRGSSPSPAWRGGLRDCWLARAQLALAAGAKADALTDAERSLAVAKSVKSSDPGDDSFSLAKTFRLVGDIERSLGDAGAMQNAWRSAFAALPGGIAERPAELNERAMILERVGRTADARLLSARLRQMGYQRAGVRSS